MAELIACDREWRNVRIKCARSYMEHVGDLMTECAVLSARAHRIRERLGLQAVLYSDSPRASVSRNDAIPDAVASLDEALAERDALLGHVAAEIAECQDTVNKLSDPRCRAILDAKYLQGMTWGEVEQATHLTERWCRELRDNGLVELYDLMPHQWRMAIPRAL